jgi:hypothetical protein
MTAISYPDPEVVSPDGRFTLEARSPHNGTINHTDDRAPSLEEFEFRYRRHQRSFRYRLLIRKDGPRTGEARVVWERWQDKGEDSPHELLVSDDGWSVIRTHGFRPEVIAVDPGGRDAVRVWVLGAGNESEEADVNDASEAPARRPETWRLKHLTWSTAGLLWAGNSWRYFFHVAERPYFVWRTFSDQRLVLDLSHAARLSEPEVGLTRAMDEHEKGGAIRLLSEVSASMDDVQRLLSGLGSGAEATETCPLRQKLDGALAALHLAGAHQVRDSVPLLRQWERIDRTRSSTGSTAFGRGWSREAQYFRPVVHHSLRLLDALPQGYAAYYFRDADGRRFPAPERIIGRRQRSAELHRGMSAKQVLQLVGSPDHVRQESHRAGKLYRWTEEWEYDFRVMGQWQTLRIVWEEYNKQNRIGREGRIAAIEELPASRVAWNERLLDIL